MDLHLHTPASTDYQEPHVSALDILQRAEARGLDIIAFTDHNSVRGYADLWREVEDLELLEYLKRLEPAEEARLKEYRRLLDKVLLLPGFEFTATFGFHVLAIFPERTSVRLMEHLLLTLGIPEDRFGSGEVGATTDVLRAYEILADHGALVIGAHVNSTHGIAMQGLRFGGQTKIAYTQDPHLHALEVTDLVVSGHRRSTARFFNGTKPEYPRRMHCIQGSDAHRLDRDPRRETNLGIGDRVTEVLLPTMSFDALKALFLGDDFARTRPYVPYEAPVDLVKAARVEGNTVTQAFHESLRTKRTGYAHVLKDIVALANTSGGTVYVGASASERRPVAGVADASAAVEELRGEIAQQVTPPLRISIEAVASDDKHVLAVRVPRGADRPYALAPGGIYVRQEGESIPAHRDQIVSMIRGAGGATRSPSPAPMAGAVPAQTTPQPAGRRAAGGRGRRGRVPAVAATDIVVTAPPEHEPLRRSDVEPIGVGATNGAASVAVSPRLEEVAGGIAPDDVSPRTGVEIVDALDQDGVTYYTMRDLRNFELTHNVTRDTGRRLWRSAIELREQEPVEEDSVRWHGDFGYWRSFKPRGGERRYHLVYRGDGDLRTFYGVSGEHLDDHWRAVLPLPRSAPAPAAASETDPEPGSIESLSVETMRAPLPEPGLAPEPGREPEPDAEPEPPRPRRTRSRTPRASRQTA